MNTIELKNKLIEMFITAMNENRLINCHSSYYITVIDTIIKYYLTVSDYYEENAIATFKLFLDKGILSFQ